MGLLKIMRENRARADADERNQAIIKRMEKLDVLLAEIPRGPMPTPYELLMDYTAEAVERIRNAPPPRPPRPRGTLRRGSTRSPGTRRAR